jgi:putative DNA methylase
VFSADGEPMSVRQALGYINGIFSEIRSGENADFDPFTRFAIDLFETHRHNDVLYGIADGLAQAKNLTTDQIVSSGIARKGGGKFRLLNRDELLSDWNPTEDSRVTVWESTQYLIRALERSEMEAAHLLNQLGGFGVPARQLAYMLYEICNKQNWADDAVKYNMLVTAWPQIQRLAAQGEQATGEKGLFE